jgi:transposase-like protein
MNGIRRGKQCYACKDCRRQFVLKTNQIRLRRKLLTQYIWRRQTLSQLAHEYGRSQRWVQRQLERVNRQICGADLATSSL